MMRVAQKGTTIVPVKVFEKTPKLIRAEGTQYWAFNAHVPGDGIDRLPIHIGHGDTVEEAVDALSEQL